MTATDVKRAIRAQANPVKARVLQRFFKTGPGEYGEGDQFHGLTVPQQRQVARQYQALPARQLEPLLRSRMHEERLVALLILVHQFDRGSEADRRRICRFYLDHLDSVNNWDLVDLTAPKILGAWLATRDRRILYRLAQSKNLWERRVAILAAFAFIRRQDWRDALALAERLLHDPEDLIHKAVGWMLREVGKRDAVVLEAFLIQHAGCMPRTMLRYAIEKFPPAKRRHYLDTKRLARRKN